MSNFEFNGITKDYIRIARDWNMPMFAPVAHDIVSVMDRPGGYLSRSSTDVRRFSVPFILLANDFPTREAFEEDMAQWLLTEFDAPLTFTKYQNRTLYARVEGTIELDQFHPMAQGQINFVCSDPYKYQPEETVNFVDDVATLDVPGTVKTPAIIELDVLQDITYADVLKADSYFRLGIPDSLLAPPAAQTELIATYPMTSLVGWTDASTVDDGTVSGTMAVDANGMYASAYGATVNPNKFQGPSKRRSLPESLQDFRMQVDVEFRNNAARTGIIEVYLKDASGNTVAKIAIQDIWASLAKMQGVFAVGNFGDRAVEKKQSASYEPAWNNFKGTLRINRVGNKFRPYFAIVDANGRHQWVYSSFLYTDVYEEHLAPIVEVQVAVRIFPNTEVPYIRLKNMQFFRYNNDIPGTPIIATTGDKILIDTRNSNVTINGEDAKDLKDFGASFLKLSPGSNQLALEPAGAFNGKVSYRGRYL